MNKTTIIYFSPTGNTKKCLEAMAETIGKETCTLDITVEENEYIPEFTAEDLVIIGAPVYGGRIPAVSAQRFSKLKGNLTPCIVAVTYGNRDFDDALLELSDLMTNQGFLVQGAAALVGRHTYGEIALNRPDARDLMEIENFASCAAKPVGQNASLEITGNHPYRQGGNGGNFVPDTLDSCTQCGLCVKVCPVHAISKDCKTIDKNCLACFRCVRSCPVHAKKVLSEEYRNFAAMFTEKLKAPQKNHFFLSVKS